MNSYGYDIYVPNEEIYLDDTSYLETISPLNKIDNFENKVNELLNEEKEGSSDKTSTLEKIINKKNILCQQLYENVVNCKNVVNYKSHKLEQSQNQIFFLYILLFFSTILIFYQKLNINNLNNFIMLLTTKRNKENVG